MGCCNQIYGVSLSTCTFTIVFIVLCVLHFQIYEIKADIGHEQASSAGNDEEVSQSCRSRPP